MASTTAAPKGATAFKVALARTKRADRAARRAVRVVCRPRHSISCWHVTLHWSPTLHIDASFYIHRIVHHISPHTATVPAGAPVQARTKAQPAQQNGRHRVPLPRAIRQHLRAQAPFSAADEGIPVARTATTAGASPAPLADVASLVVAVAASDLGGLAEVC